MKKLFLLVLFLALSSGLFAWEGERWYSVQSIFVSAENEIVAVTCVAGTMIGAYALGSSGVTPTAVVAYDSCGNTIGITAAIDTDNVGNAPFVIYQGFVFPYGAPFGKIKYIGLPFENGVTLDVTGDIDLILQFVVTGGIPQ